MEFYIWFLNASFLNASNLIVELKTHPNLFIYLFFVFSYTEMYVKIWKKRYAATSSSLRPSFCPNRASSVNQYETLSYWSWASVPSLMLSPDFLAVMYNGFSSLQWQCWANHLNSHKIYTLQVTVDILYWKKKRKKKQPYSSINPNVSWECAKSSSSETGGLKGSHKMA